MHIQLQKEEKQRVMKIQRDNQKKADLERQKEEARKQSQIQEEEKKIAPKKKNKKHRKKHVKEKAAEIKEEKDKADMAILNQAIEENKSSMRKARQKKVIPFNLYGDKYAHHSDQYEHYDANPAGNTQHYDCGWGNDYGDEYDDGEYEEEEDECSESYYDDDHYDTQHFGILLANSSPQILDQYEKKPSNQ